MESRANGWPVIARYLDLRGWKQCDLARILKLSPAAVTQIKKGESLLSPEQIATIIRGLQISDHDITELYTDIFNCRILQKGDESGRGGDFQVVRKQRRQQGYLPPRRGNTCCELSLLHEYEPALEGLDDFICRRTGNRCSEGRIVLLLGKQAPSHGLPPGSTLLVAVEEYPVPNDLVLASARGGSLLLRRYVPDAAGCVKLKCEYTAGEDLLWQLTADPGQIRWMLPVIEIVINLKEN